MDKEQQRNRRNVAQWLGISQSTLRGWDARFRQWLESQPGEFQDSTRKIYTETDLVVFQAIRQLRDEGKNYDEIEKALDAEIARTVPAWPGEGEASRAVENDSKPSPREVSSTELITLERQYLQKLARAGQDAAAAAARLEALEEEQERLRTELAAEREARVKAEREAADAAARLAERNKPLWQRLFGGGN